MSSLADILRQAPKTVLEEYVLARGTIIQSADPDKFILQRSPASRAEWAEVHAADVLRGPWPVDPRDLDAADRGHPVHEMGIRKGAVVRHVQEHGFEAHQLSPRSFSHGAAVTAAPGHPIALKEVLKAAPAQLGHDHVLFEGVVQPYGDDDLLLAPLPNDHTECAVIRRGDVLGHEQVDVVPADSLPVSFREFTVVRLRVRPAAQVRVLFQRHRHVELSAPECLGAPGGCGCQGSEAAGGEATGGHGHGHAHTHVKPIGPIAGVRQCKTYHNPGEDDVYCTNPGAKCGWIFDSVCTLHGSMFGVLYCNCD